MKTVVCESCNHDVEVIDSIGIVLQGEIFCQPCHEEWKEEYSINE